MITEVGYTPSGNRVTIEIDQRVEGPGPHIFVYTEGGRRYRVAVRQGRTARETATPAVRWYVRYRLSYAEVSEWLAERGILVDVQVRCLGDNFHVRSCVDAQYPARLLPCRRISSGRG